MFWIVDSILMQKKKKQLSNLSVHYHPLPRDRNDPGEEESDTNSLHSSPGSDVELERRKP